MTIDSESLSKLRFSAAICLLIATLIILGGKWVINKPCSFQDSDIAYRAYDMGGDIHLAPTSVFDTGHCTFMEFNQDMPASVYEVTEKGEKFRLNPNKDGRYLTVKPVFATSHLRLLWSRGKVDVYRKSPRQ